MAESKLTKAQTEALVRWRDAEQARHDTINAYNAKLVADRARGEFPPRIEPEYRAMEAARRFEYTARDALFLTIREAGRDALQLQGGSEQ